MFDWDAEPAPISEKTGKELKKKPIPKRCTKACRNFTPPEVPNFQSMEPYTDDEIMEKEMDLLGIHLSHTPFDRLPDDIWGSEVSEGMYVLRGSEIESGGNGHYVTVGLVTRIREITDKNGNDMGFFGLNAYDAELDLTVFHNQWETFQRDLRVGSLCFVILKKNSRGMTLQHLQAT